MTSQLNETDCGVELGIVCWLLHHRQSSAMGGWRVMHSTDKSTTITPVMCFVVVTVYDNIRRCSSVVTEIQSILISFANVKLLLHRFLATADSPKHSCKAYKYTRTSDQKHSPDADIQNTSFDLSLPIAIECWKLLRKRYFTVGWCSVIAKLEPLTDFEDCKRFS